MGNDKKVPLPYPRVNLTGDLVWFVAWAIVGFNLMVFGHGIGTLGWGCWAASLILGLAAVNYLKTNNKTIFLSVLVALGALAGVAIRSNKFVTGVDLGLMALTLAIVVAVGQIKNLRWKVENVAMAAIRFGWELIPHSTDLVSTVLSLRNNRYKSWGAIVRIILISTALVGVFGVLLFASDPVFARIVNDIFANIWNRVLASIVVGLVVLWITSLEIMERVEERDFFGWLKADELTISVIVLEVLFACFLAIQAKYLFASHEVFQTFGITYSDYVRRGFFELIIAVALGGVLSYILGGRMAGVVAKNKYRVVSLILIAELGLMLFSAWRRDVLYMEMHGLTRIRIVGEVASVGLIGLLGLLVARDLWPEMTQERFLIGVAIVVLGVVGYLNWQNLDARIAAHPPIRFDQKDYFYISNLSPDAIAGWEESMAAGERLARELEATHNQPATFNSEMKWRVANMQLALETIQAKRNDLMARYAKDIEWQKFNVSEYLAANRIGANRPMYYDTLDWSLSVVEKYVQRNNYDYDLRMQKDYIMNDFDYPLMQIERVR